LVRSVSGAHAHSHAPAATIVVTADLDMAALSAAGRISC
jgi:hypothetical protein